MELTTIGIDLAKRVFQVHGVDRRGKAVLCKRVSRGQLGRLVAGLPRCVVAMEACSGAHHWGRLFEGFGHEVRLVPARYAKAYVKTNKTDAADAAAICEAAQRRHMRFVPLKTEQQQAVQAQHRALSRLTRNRTALANQMRGILVEFGVVMATGMAALRRAMATEDLPGDIPPLARELLAELREELRDLDRRIEALKRRLAGLNRADPRAMLLKTIPGIGDLNASALANAVGNAAAFGRGRDMAAWLGVVPREHSSAGKQRLYGISKRGDGYLRCLLIHGARSYLQQVARRADKPANGFERWIVSLLARRHRNAVAVAVANKLARIAWAVLRHSRPYDPARFAATADAG